MPRIEFHQPTQRLVPRSPEWFAARKGRVTASRIAAMCKLNDRTSESYAKLVQRTRAGEKPVFTHEAFRHMYRGNVAEMAVLLEITRCLRMPIFETGVFQRGDVLATPDAIACDGRGYYVVEAKSTVTLPMDPPLAYLVQVHAQMYAANARRALLVMSDASRTTIWRVDFCPVFWSTFIERGVTQFARDVASDKAMGRSSGLTSLRNRARATLSRAGAVTCAHTGPVGDEVVKALEYVEASM